MELVCTDEETAVSIPPRQQQQRVKRDTVERWRGGEVPPMKSSGRKLRKGVSQPLPIGCRATGGEPVCAPLLTHVANTQSCSMRVSHLQPTFRSGKAARDVGNAFVRTPPNPLRLPILKPRRVVDTHLECTPLTLSDPHLQQSPRVNATACCISLCAKLSEACWHPGRPSRRLRRRRWREARCCRGLAEPIDRPQT